MTPVTERWTRIGIKMIPTINSVIILLYLCTHSNTIFIIRTKQFPTNIRLLLSIPFWRRWGCPSATSDNPFYPGRYVWPPAFSSYLLNSILIQVNPRFTYLSSVLIKWPNYYSALRCFSVSLKNIKAYNKGDGYRGSVTDTWNLRMVQLNERALDICFGGTSSDRI